MISACSMVGTSRVSVTLSCSMVCSTSSGSNAGTNTCGLPTSPWPMTADMAAPWNIGAICRHTRSAGTGYSAIRPTADDHRFMCDCITPFGQPVVPPVYMMLARSLPPR
ncbi:hypothetical protein D3C76_1068020 [compost metagenome]